MAEIDDLRAILPEDHFTDLEVAGDDFLVSYRQSRFEIPIADVEAYLAVRENLQKPETTSIFYPGHYECLVEPTGSLGLAPVTFRLREQPIRIERADRLLSAEVSVPSSAFVLAMASGFNDTFRRRVPYIGIGVGVGRGRQRESVREFFGRFLTIKIHATNESVSHARSDELRRLAEACLFNLAYGGKTLLSLARSWDRGRRHIRKGRPQDVQFPKRTYNSDLVSYYRLGLGSDSLLLAYLAFYKILEHFFPAVTELGLQKRMSEKLVAPEFSHTKPLQLRQLANIVRKYDQKMDEEKMLAAVIAHFFPPDQLEDWVTQFERERGQYYTAQQDVLGRKQTLDLNAEQIASCLAARIYHVRNALVHNKEGEVARFIPYSGQEAVLVSEIPIVQFLAEQIIVKDGKDIEPNP